MGEDYREGTGPGQFIDYSEANRLTLGDLFKRYIREDKHKKNKSWKMYEFRTNILLKDTIANTNLLRLSFLSGFATSNQYDQSDKY